MSAGLVGGWLCCLSLPVGTFLHPACQPLDTNAAILPQYLYSDSFVYSGCSCTQFLFTLVLNYTLHIFSMSTDHPYTIHVLLLVCCVLVVGFHFWVKLCSSCLCPSGSWCLVSQALKTVFLRLVQSKSLLSFDIKEYWLVYDHWLYV